MSKTNDRSLILNFPTGEMARLAKALKRYNDSICADRDILSVEFFKHNYAGKTPQDMFAVRVLCSNGVFEEFMGSAAAVITRADSSNMCTHADMSFRDSQMDWLTISTVYDEAAQFDHLVKTKNWEVAENAHVPGE